MSLPLRRLILICMCVIGTGFGMTLGVCFGAFAEVKDEPGRRVDCSGWWLIPLIGLGASIVGCGLVFVDCNRKRCFAEEDLC